MVVPLDLLLVEIAQEVGIQPLGLAEVEACAFHCTGSGIGNAVRAHWLVAIGVNLQHLGQTVITIAAVQVEIGVVGEVAGRGRVRGGGVDDRQGIVVVQPVLCGSVQIARKPLVAGRAEDPERGLVLIG